MKLKHLNIALLAAAGFVFQGCSDDFLDVPSTEIIEAGDTDVKVTPEEFVNGIYGMFTEWDYAFSFLAITDMISDNSDKGSEISDPGGDKMLFDELTFTTTAGSLESMWQRWYKSIGRATESIKYTEEFGLTDATYKNRLIGEAQFLRALNYFYLVRGWGDIPIQEISVSERKPANEVYDYIVADLLAAIGNLPDKSAYPAKDLGRATKGAAQALLAKVYLYRQDWQNAFNMAKTVIGSGQYSLETDYAKIWRAETENGKESIFEFQGRGQSIAHGIQQYSETQGPRGGTTPIGWGFNTPSQNLVDAFDAAGDEIRKDATIIFDGETLWDGTVISSTINPRYNEKAFSSANRGAGDGDKNIRYLRLGEVYLILAEAANELNNNSEATGALNIVRDRVDLDPISDNNQASLRQKIWNERRLELAMEHDRWFDLVRTKQAETAMKANGKAFLPKHYLFPIPEAQRVQTPDMTQNQDW